MKKKILAILLTLSLISGMALPGTMAVEAETGSNALSVETESNASDETVYTGTLICELDEHSHSEDECYTLSEEPTCGLTQTHVHEDSCYEMQEQTDEETGEKTQVKVLICEEEEIIPHEHGDGCYAAGELTCAVALSEGHTHGEGCYLTATELTCGLSGDENHTHGDECYTETSSLVCTETESEGHAHEAACYSASTLTCNQEELPEHTHSADCYEMPLTCEKTEHRHTAECYQAEDTCTCGADGLFHTSECPLYAEPVTAAVYTEKDGVYTLLEAHDSANPLDMSAYNGKTVYILANTQPQNLYFTASGLVNTGVTYSVSESEYALLTSGDDKFTNHTALLTVAENAPAGTEFTLSAEGWIVTSYTVTVKVLDKLPEESGEPADTIYTESVEFDHGDLGIAFAGGTFASDQVALNAYVPELTDDQLTQIKSVIGEDVLACYPMDISFTSDGQELQPLSGKSVTVHMTLDASCVPEDANMMVVVHLGAGGAEIVKEQYLSSGVDQQSLLFNASSFSTYVNVLVNSKYNAQHLSSQLSDSSDYSVVDLKNAGATINLFNYVPNTFNSEDGGSVTTKFMFLGANVQDSQSAGINNSTAAYAKQGILKDILTDGLPSMQYGTDLGSALFGTAEYAGKTVYSNVGFEFIYDETTGNYIYASALNHAQYNETSEKVELYADSLAVVNSPTRTVSMDQTPTEPEGVTITSYAASGITGTLGDMNDANKMDSCFALTVDSFTGAATDKVYVKIKTDRDVSGCGFQLFFEAGETEFDESKKLTAIYPAWTENLDGWYEYEIVIDISDQQDKDAWTSTITKFRVDVIDTTGNFGGMKFVLEGISVVPQPDATKNSNTNGGFYPFSSIQDSYPGQNDQFSEDTWTDNIGNADGTHYYQGTRAIYNGTSSGTNIDHLYLGLSASIPFYMPVDGTLNGEDIIYTFNGDDDLWVFIDGKLVLDVGGGHGAINGTINLTTGEWTVENAVTVSEVTTQDDVTGSKKTGDVGAVTAGNHTMQIFYLERAGSVSNCFMKFNLPLIPTGAMSIEKQISYENIAPDANTEYKFTLSATDVDGDKVDALNYTYRIYENGQELNNGELSTLQSNTLTLKAGQRAVFDNVPEGTTVTVTEVTPTVGADAYYKYVSTTVKVGDAAETVGLTGSQKTVEGTELKFVFTNKYEDAYFDLTIVKTGSNETLDPNQSFIFRVQSADGEVDMLITIVGNGSTTIKHLPFQNYTVTEDENWSWRYTATSGSGSQTVVVESQNETVTVNNERDQIYWLDGNSWCWNLFKDTGIVKKEPDDTDGTD